jgi:hypothetical protein
MKQNIQFEYSFEKKAKILGTDSIALKTYEQGFETQVKPAMQQIEKRKSRAHEKAATIRISQ